MQSNPPNPRARSLSIQSIQDILSGDRKYRERRHPQWTELLALPA
jgi:hypothetical protein